MFRSDISIPVGDSLGTMQLRLPGLFHALTTVLGQVEDPGCSGDWIAQSFLRGVRVRVSERVLPACDWTINGSPQMVLRPGERSPPSFHTHSDLIDCGISLHHIERTRAIPAWGHFSSRTRTIPSLWGKMTRHGKCNPSSFGPDLQYAHKMDIL